MRGAGMGLVRAGPVPEHADHLGGPEGEQCAKARGGHAAAAVSRTPLAPGEEEAEHDKLRNWHERIAGRDAHDAPGGEAAIEAIAEAGKALERYTAAVHERTQL